MIIRIMMTLALLCGFAGAAAAQPTSAQQNAVKQNCRSDYMSYCSSVPTGGKAALNCLQEHLVDLTPACQSAVSAAEAAMTPGGGKAGGAPPAQAQGGGGGGGAMPMRERMAMMRGACGQDFRDYCHGVPMGGGRAMGCLEENQARLSPQCRGMLSQMHR